MENMIGSMVTISQNYEIETAIGNKKITVKEGDEGFIDSSGLLHYTTGEAQGKIQPIKDCTIKGYAHGDIAELISKRLFSHFGLGDILEDYSIEKEDFMNEIEDVLESIL